MTCFEIISEYGLRSVGFGPRALPKNDFSVCLQITLIGSGLIWNIYFGVLALSLGFFASIFLAVGSLSRSKIVQKPIQIFILVFRGSPLFIQFFFAYFLFLSVKKSLGILSFLTSAWSGALIVLFLNTCAYSAHIFAKAIKSSPRSEKEAGQAFGLSGFLLFRRVTLPSTLRLAWPAYTNEAIFLFHATTLVFFSAFPTWQQKGDALYYANYFADKTFNPFVPYPILAGYFILITAMIILIFGLINARLNRHIPKDERAKFRLNLNFIR